MLDNHELPNFTDLKEGLLANHTTSESGKTNIYSNIRYARYIGEHSYDEALSLWSRIVKHVSSQVARNGSVG